MNLELDLNLIPLKEQVKISRGKCNSWIWTKEKTLELIALFEFHSDLWNVSSEQYSNRNHKKNLQKEIATRMKLDPTEIAGKLHNLRCQYNAELRRLKIKKSGSGTDEVYVPRWEFFNALKFLTNGDQSCSTTSNLELDLNLIPLKEQVNVIWLSKSISDRVQLERKCKISSPYISAILRCEKELMARWLKAYERRKTDRAKNSQAEAYKYSVIDRILGEWIHRKMNELSRTMQPFEIEQQANIITQQLGVANYHIGFYIWNREFIREVYNKNGSSDTEEILDELRLEILEETFIEFKKKINELSSKQIYDGSHIETIDQKNCINVSEEAQIIKTSEGSDAIELHNVDLTHEDYAEECDDQQCNELNISINQYEDLTCILSDSEEQEHSKFLETSQKESCDMTSLIADEESVQETGKEEVVAMKITSIQEDSLFEDFREEVLQDSSHKSDEESINEPKGPIHLLHGDQSITVKSTDSIEDLVRKYQLYINRDQQLSVLGRKRKLQQDSCNENLECIDISEEEAILNNKQKCGNNISSKCMQEYSFISRK